MKLSILTYPLTISLLLSAGSVLGQIKKDTQPSIDKKPKGEQQKGTINEEVEVVRPYKPILADAVKIRINPNLTNNPTFKPRLIYTVLDKTLRLDSNIAKLQAQKLFEEKPLMASNNYFKVAIGNLNTTLGELYLNNGKDEALQVGLAVKHLAQQGDLNKQQFSHQEVTIFGRSIGRRATLGGQFKYDRLQTYFYGFNPTMISSTAIHPAQQQFDLLEAKGDLLNNYKEGNRFSYKLIGSAYLLKNISEARENNVLVSASLNQVVNKLNFGIGASIDLTNSKDATYSIDNHIFKAYPYAKIQGNNVILDLGINLVQEYGNRSRLHIFPTVSATFPIAPGYANLFAGIRGDVVKTNLKDLASENPYLNQNAALTNTVEKINIYGGIKGNAGHALGFKATVFFKQIENMQLFQNSLSQIDRFYVIYDGGQSKVFGIEGELEIKASEIFNLVNKIQANNYTMATEKEAWLKPSLRLTSTGRAKITSKLSLNAEIVLNSKTYAKTINAASSVEAVRINDYADLSAGAEYQVAKKVRIYLQATNILGTPYEQYLYYPKLGLGIFGGFNFSF